MTGNRKKQMADEKGEKCRIHILRWQDRAMWKAEVASGNQVAKLCSWAASKFVRAMPEEASWCACCDTLFASGDKPRAFIILIPIEYDSEKVRASAVAVCSECSKHDDEWLKAQGLWRKGLPPTPARPGDKLH